MKIERTDLPGVMLFKPDRYEDNRGYFMETLNKYHSFAPVQANMSKSKKRVVRGLHNQPGASKLVWVAHGKILDVAYDPATKKYVSFELSAENGGQLLIPGDMFHGVQALENNTVICYLMDDFYNPKTETALNPDIVDWPLKGIISKKDAGAPYELINNL